MQFESESSLLKISERIRSLAPMWITSYALVREDGVLKLEIGNAGRKYRLDKDEAYRVWLQCMTCDRPWCQPPLHDYC